MTQGTSTRRVLVVTYEFPPSAGGGVQRVAKFARYLPEAGWEPVVLTSVPVSGRPRDESLLPDVDGFETVRIPPRNLAEAVARAASGFRRDRSADAVASAERVTDEAPKPHRPARSRQVAAWLAVPDFAGWWIGPAVASGVGIGRERAVDAVFASGPPHSVLVAGARIARKLGVPFVADFRDAWRDNASAWYPSAWHRSRAMAAELEVVGQSDTVTAVSEPIADEVRSLGAHMAVRIPNGFDPADVVPWRPSPGPARIAFMGHMYPAASDPHPLLDAMVLAAQRSEAAGRLTLEIIGPDPSFVREAVAARGLGERVVFHGYRPHREALELLASADAGVVLLRDAPESRAIYTSKLFEYLGVGIPVLLVGPTDGVAADLVREAQAGWITPSSDPHQIAETLVEIARRKAEGAPTMPSRPEVVARFDRRAQARTLGELLDAAVEGRAR